MLSAHELYSSAVEPLSAPERLRLATLILEGLTADALGVDYSDAWSEQDLRDVSAYSQQQAGELLGEE
jgi:hypothetical protein